MTGLWALDSSVDLGNGLGLRGLCPLDLGRFIPHVKIELTWLGPLQDWAWSVFANGPISLFGPRTIFGPNSLSPTL